MIFGSKTWQHQSPDMLHTSVLRDFQLSLSPYLIWGSCSSFRYHCHPFQPSWQLENDFLISFHFLVMLTDDLVLQLLVLEVPALPTMNDNSHTLIRLCGKNCPTFACLLSRRLSLCNNACADVLKSSTSVKWSSSPLSALLTIRPGKDMAWRLTNHSESTSDWCIIYTRIWNMQK